MSNSHLSRLSNPREVSGCALPSRSSFPSSRRVMPQHQTAPESIPVVLTTHPRTLSCSHSTFEASSSFEANEGGLRTGAPTRPERLMLLPMNSGRCSRETRGYTEASLQRCTTSPFPPSCCPSLDKCARSHVRWREGLREDERVALLPRLCKALVVIDGEGEERSSLGPPT